MTDYRIYGDAVPDIMNSAQKYQVPPLVALAMATGEGGLNYGSVGDGGTSFGPYQLHEGGALPPGKDAAWANSPAGIDYAIRQIASVIGTRNGHAAIAAGVTNFERPSAQYLQGEIASDESWYDKQASRSAGKTLIADAKGYHPITSAQEALQGGLTSVVPGLGSLTGAVSGWFSDIEGFLLRTGKVLLGIFLIAAVVFLAVKT
jgi:hypothetical protein